MKTVSSRDNAFYKELKHLAGSTQALRNRIAQGFCLRQRGDRGGGLG